MQIRVVVRRLLHVVITVALRRDSAQVFAATVPNFAVAVAVLCATAPVLDTSVPNLAATVAILRATTEKNADIRLGVAATVPPNADTALSQPARAAARI